MKRNLIIFLKAVIILVAAAVLASMIRFPLTEGRAADLDLFHIYWDPFIVYAYVASIPFFVALFQAFRLLGLIGENKTFSQESVKALRIIKYSAIIESAAIIMAVICIRMFHDIDDDPAGFIALGIMATFISAIIATVAAVFEGIFLEGITLKKDAKA
jgi:hypothetical protein